jgi:hypothetical protein
LPVRQGFPIILSLAPVNETLTNSSHPETVFSRPGGVNQRVYLCGVLMYVSAQPLDFLDSTKKYSFPDWKPNKKPLQLVSVRKRLFALYNRITANTPVIEAKQPNPLAKYII